VAAAMKEKRHADIAALLDNVNILMEEK